MSDRDNTTDAVSGLPALTLGEEVTGEDVAAAMDDDGSVDFDELAARNGFDVDVYLLSDRHEGR